MSDTIHCEHCGGSVCPDCGRGDCRERAEGKECDKARIRRMEARVRELEEAATPKQEMPDPLMPYRPIQPQIPAPFPARPPSTPYPSPTPWTDPTKIWYGSLLPDERPVITVGLHGQHATS